MTMRKNSSSLKKFDRYEHMINDLGLQNLFIGLLKSGVKDFDLSATLGRLEKYIPELSEFRAAIQQITTPLPTAVDTPTATNSKNIRRGLMKRAELLRERAVQFQVSINSAMATHFLFFETFSISNNEILQQYKESLGETGIKETWRFPEIKWSQKEIRAGVVLAQYSDSQELVSWDLILTGEGIEEVQELAGKFQQTSTEDERETLQAEYRNLLLVQRASKKRVLRLPTQSQLEKIAVAVSDLAKQSETERTDGDSLRLISEKSESSNILTDYVVRAMSWGASNKVEFNFSVLLEAVKEVKELDKGAVAKELYIEGIKLHLTRSGINENAEKLCREIEEFYSRSIEPEATKDEAQTAAVEVFAEKEAERVENLLESYKQKLDAGLSNIPEQQENLDEYLRSLGDLFERSKLKKQIILDVEDYLADLAPTGGAIEDKDSSF
jgi:hypothetical protein